MHKIHSELLQDFGIAELKNSTILQAEGADAATFLQGQFSQDISKLKDLESCFAGLSNPKGRLIATAYICKQAQDRYYLILPSLMLTEVQKQLTKYVMRSKVQFSQRQDLFLSGLWNATFEELNAFECHIKLAEHANVYIAISEQETIADMQTEDQWTLQKILHVIPEIGPETQEHFVAQMLNMDVLDGISFHKGCYTGQEVIARMQHLGRVKRRTLLLETDKDYSPGEKVMHADKSIGEIVNSIRTDDKNYALAVMQLDKLADIDKTVLHEKSGLKFFEPAYALEQVV